MARRPDQAEYTRKKIAARRKQYAPRGACALCGSTDRLVWDHIDPATKSFGIMDHLTYSEARIEAEIAKCRVLCNYCNVMRSSRFRLKDHVQAIRTSTESRSALARRYGVSYQAIRLVQVGKSYG